MRIHISIRKTLNSSNITLHFLWSSALYPPTQAFLGELVLWGGMKNELPVKTPAWEAIGIAVCHFILRSALHVDLVAPAQRFLSNISLLCSVVY